MTPLVSTSMSDQAAGLPTASQANVTQASHSYLANRHLCSRNVTTEVNSGEAELS
jgi:hypothetical protein